MKSIASNFTSESWKESLTQENLLESIVNHITAVLLFLYRDFLSDDPNKFANIQPGLVSRKEGNYLVV